MKITEIQKKKYENRLKELQEDEPKLKIVVKNAQDLGDFSENSELDAARSELANNRLEQSSIKNILNSAEVVPYDKSNLITIGSLVEVVCPLLNDGKKTTMLISDSGDCLLEGVLNTSTPLGKIVVGNVSGEFRVGNNICSVTKITKPNLDEFISMYPSDDAVLKRYFFSNLNEEKIKEQAGTKNEVGQQFVEETVHEEVVEEHAHEEVVKETIHEEPNTNHNGETVYTVEYEDVIHEEPTIEQVVVEEPKTVIEQEIAIDTDGSISEDDFDESDFDESDFDESDFEGL